MDKKLKDIFVILALLRRKKEKKLSKVFSNAKLVRLVIQKSSSIGRVTA